MLRHGSATLAHRRLVTPEEALENARRCGLPALLAPDFQQRAAILKALAQFLAEHKEQPYAVSAHTGATRADSWIGIQGGTGTLLGHAGLERAEVNRIAEVLFQRSGR